MAYSQDQKDKICEYIFTEVSKGRSLPSVLKDEGMPADRTFDLWLLKDPVKLAAYARAREKRADAIFEEILEIANTPIEGKTITTDDRGKTMETKGDMIAHRKLQIDARKWMLSKMLPKKYGDKLITEGTQVNVNHNIEVSKDEAKRINDALEDQY